MDGLDAMIRQLGSMGDDSEKVSKAMLTAAAEKTKTAWRNAIESHGLVDTGDMLESVGYRAPGRSMSVEIYPQGTDRKGVRNATKAFVLHFGSSSIEGTRFVDDAYKGAEAQGIPAMEEVLGEVLDTGKVPNVPRTPNHPSGVNNKG